MHSHQKASRSLAFSTASSPAATCCRRRCCPPAWRADNPCLREGAATLSILLCDLRFFVLLGAQASLLPAACRGSSLSLLCACPLLPWRSAAPPLLLAARAVPQAPAEPWQRAQPLAQPLCLLGPLLGKPAPARNLWLRRRAPTRPMTAPPRLPPTLPRWNGTPPAPTQVGALGRSSAGVAAMQHGEGCLCRATSALHAGKVLQCGRWEACRTGCSSPPWCSPLP